MKSNDLLMELNKNKFDKQLAKITKKLAGKSVVIYGAGVLFELIHKNYDLSGLSILGISDRKFSSNDYEDNSENSFLGYKIIPLSKIKEVNPDYVLVSVLRSLDIVEDFETNEFKDTKIKVRPLVKSPIIQALKEIWCN